MHIKANGYLLKNILKTTYHKQCSVLALSLLFLRDFSIISALSVFKILKYLVIRPCVIPACWLRGHRASCRRWEDVTEISLKKKKKKKKDNTASVSALGGQS